MVVSGFCDAVLSPVVPVPRVKGVVEGFGARVTVALA